MTDFQRFFYQRQEPEASRLSDHLQHDHPLEPIGRAALIRKVAIAISEQRAIESGGCFRPDDEPQTDDCSNFNCYCFRQCEREAEASLRATMEWFAERWGNSHPGAIAIAMNL